MKYSEKLIIENIKKLKVKPNRGWQSLTAKRLEILQDDVTKVENDRSMFHTIYYFLTMEFKKPLVVTVATFVVVGLATTATVFAAQDSKPGDLLYPLDKVIEDVQRTLTVGDAAKAKLEVDILHERLDELSSLSTDNSESENDSYNEVVEQEHTTEDKLKNTDGVDAESYKEYEKYRSELEAYSTETQLAQPTLVPRNDGESEHNNTSPTGTKTVEPTEKPENSETPENTEVPHATEKPESTKTPESR